MSWRDDGALPICCTCGNQYSASPAPPSTCKVCTDDRQWLPATGPEWTSLDALAQSGHKNVITEIEANVYSIHTEPKVGIGQRCILVKDKSGDAILWDCIPFLDAATIQAVRALVGGLTKIVVSHPHFLGSCATWSKAFEDVLIFLHASDKEWVTFSDTVVPYVFWPGEWALPLNATATMEVVRLGGHFPSSAVLLVNSSSKDGKPILFTGDTILPVPHGRWCSFMYSFPNLLPLPAFIVEEILAKVQELRAFDRLYGPFPTSCILGGAKAAVVESAQRYLDSLAGKYHGK